MTSYERTGGPSFLPCSAREGRPEYGTYIQWAGGSATTRVMGGEGRMHMNIFYVIGVVVVVLAVFGYIRLG